MIQLSNVVKTYGPKTALHSLSLTVEPGEVLGLLGPNGAGKTTTIHILAGFLRPDSGAVQVAGVDVVKSPDAARKRIGYIPENVALYPFLDARENLTHFAGLAGIELSGDDCDRRLIAAGLSAEALRRKVSTYSKGMRQKVGIAIASSKDAQALILDEPASGLDPYASHELSMLVRRVADEGTAVLMATHDLFRAKETCDRVVILRDGQLVDELAPQAISANALEEAYLEHMRSDA